MFDNDFKSRKEMRKVIFGDPKKDKTNYSFSNILRYIFAMILLAVIVSIIRKYFL